MSRDYLDYLHDLFSAFAPVTTRAMFGGHGVYRDGVIIAIVWSAVVSFIAIHIVKALIGLRVSDSDERQGLDVTTHGENAYN